MKENKKYGVIVGRFQVDSLHMGHLYFILKVLKKCDHLCIFVGHRVVRSKSDPLPVELRIQSIETLLKDQMSKITILPLPDVNDDKIWVSNLIEKVSNITNDSNNVTYFGSRGSFLPYLPETLNKKYIVSLSNDSGSYVRSNIKSIDSKDFRSGYIKAVNDEFASHPAVVDILVTKGDKVLIGFKNKFMEYCTIGGFCDATDLTMEVSAVRELKEETGLNADANKMRYLMSSICDSWMYNRHRSPYTVAYTIEWEESMGKPSPGDDIDKLFWMNFDQALNSVGPSHHKKMIQKLIDLRK